jgi:hypothetical protein
MNRLQLLLVVVSLICSISAHVNKIVSNGKNLNGGSWNGENLNGENLNGFRLNGLTLNGLELNGVNFNGLNSPNITLGVFLLNQLGDTWNVSKEFDGEPLQFAHYMISCGLPRDRNLTIMIEGSQTVVMNGLFGVIPNWAAQPPSESEERALTGCLLSHINAKGIKVLISIRSDGFIGADEEEQESFPVHEGAFFGSLKHNQLYACWAEEPESALARSPDRQNRLCTDKSEPCNISALGPCSESCTSYSEELGWDNCKVNGTTYSEVFNTYLSEEGPQPSSTAPRIQYFLAFILVLSYLLH